MQRMLKQCALAGCVSIAVSGCATHQASAPEYRLSSSSAAQADGASMLQRGRAQLDAGLDALAIESFRAEIRYNPESADAYNGLAVAYGRIGRDDLAQRYFETALAKDPSNDKAHANLARLTGETAPRAEFANADRIEPQIFEPIAITAIDGEYPAGQLLDRLEIPATTIADMAIVEASLESPVQSLASRGVLSTRFAVAPAQMATPIKPMPLRDRPNDPRQAPTPALPPVTLTTDYRSTGTRLERVSLGEVRLITTMSKPARVAVTQPQFNSFGDRMAAWLPQSIAAEQTGNRHGMIESAVIMAAVERAEAGQVLASAFDPAKTDLPEFAYLFFQQGEDAASV
jgi:hypothetical protein